MSGIVVASSAALAVLLSEATMDAVLEALDAVEARLMSSASLVELAIVLEARIGPSASGIIDRFVRDGGIDVVPLDRSHADRAVEGWRRFGKGRHAAALNLGDCFTYGLAVDTGHPVLCVGDDFARTDAPVVAL